MNWEIDLKIIHQKAGVIKQKYKIFKKGVSLENDVHNWKCERTSLESEERLKSRKGAWRKRVPKEVAKMNWPVGWVTGERKMKDDEDVVE
jgi:hypothetical protein